MQSICRKLHVCHRNTCVSLHVSEEYMRNTYGKKALISSGEANPLAGPSPSLLPSSSASTGINSTAFLNAMYASTTRSCIWPNRTLIVPFSPPPLVPVFSSVPKYNRSSPTVRGTCIRSFSRKADSDASALERVGAAFMLVGVLVALTAEPVFL